LFDQDGYFFGVGDVDGVGGAGDFCGVAFGVGGVPAFEVGLMVRSAAQKLPDAIDTVLAGGTYFGAVATWPKRPVVCAPSDGSSTVFTVFSVVLKYPIIIEPQV
jgi:hypothetical protein